MEAKITKTELDGWITSAKDCPKDTWIWDTGKGSVQGFGVRIKPKASAVTFLLRYRPKGMRGRPQFSIGRYGSPWTVEMAREEARRLLGEVVDGGNPLRDRKDDRKAQTVGEYVADYLDAHKGKRKQSGIDQYTRVANKHFVSLAGRLAKELRREEVERWHQSYAGGTETQANRAVTFLAAVLNWGAARGLEFAEGRNPAKGIEMFPEMERERFLTSGEINQLLKTMVDMEAAGENPWAIGCFRLLLLTGARVNEIMSARSKWVDQDAGTIRLPDHKTSNKTKRGKTIYLNEAAIQVIRTMPKAVGPWLIPGKTPDKHLIGIEKIWRRVRMRATHDSAGTMNFDDLRLHDLRHAYATILASNGTDLHTIGALLGHSDPSRTTKRYAHFLPGHLQQAAEVVGDVISRATKGA